MSLLSLRAAVLAGAVLLGVGLRAECAQAATIDSESPGVGTAPSNQYAGVGATFASSRVEQKEKETDSVPAIGPPVLDATISEDEPNDTAATATPLTFTPTAIVTAALNPGGDVDFYTFTAPAGSRVWIETDTGGTQNAGATSRDTVIDLLAADGTTVIENDDDDGTGNGGDGTNETGLASMIAGRTLVAGGTYFIRVRAFSPTGIVNPYRLFVSLTNVAATAEVEPNDTAATANVANSPALRSGSINVAGDVDYYSVSANAGDTILFLADGDPARTGTGTDLVVEFRDPADALLLSVDSSINGTAANPAAEGANYTVSAAGTYFIKVRHFSATGTGTYHLHVVRTLAVAAPLLISEFRVRGPSGANDEYVEIYNNSNTDTTVASQVGTGYAIAASDAVVRCTIPNGTVIPARGHFLCTNSVAYSLGGYATGDATFTTDIPDNAGIALFNNNVPANFILANRLDAVGSTSEANTLYKEGTGYPALTPFSIDYAFVRDQCGDQGSITSMVPCTTSSPIDTNNNAVDFYFVDSNGTSAGAGQRLGSAGPQNLASPISGGNFIAALPLDSTVNLVPPNVVRDFTSVPAQNSTFGTISIRKRFVNNTGAPLTRLRFRVVDIATFPAPSGTADLRTRTSGAVVVAGINDAATCAATGAPATPPCTVTVQGTTLEQPPSQPNGGAFNGTFSVPTVTLGTPLANGASINLQFLFGLQQTGAYKVGMIAEGVTQGGDVFMVICHTDASCTPTLASAVSRHVHGGTTFDLPLSLVPAPGINHNPTTEPRQGPTHTIVFTFDKPLSVAFVSFPEGTASLAPGSAIVGSTAVINLSGVNDIQYVTVSLTNVGGTDGTVGGSGSARIGFLAGDVNQGRTVTLTDLVLVNNQQLKPLTISNYLTDVNATGSVTVSDKVIVNGRLLHALPAP